MERDHCNLRLRFVLFQHENQSRSSSNSEGPCCCGVPATFTLRVVHGRIFPIVMVFSSQRPANNLLTENNASKVS